MNGQIYDVRTRDAHKWDSSEWVVPRVTTPTKGWHAPHVASYSSAFTGSGRVWAIEVLDDDGNFNSRVTENLTRDQLEAFKLRYRDGTATVAKDAWRPRSITAYTVSRRTHGDDDDGEYAFSTRFSVSWIADNWGADSTQNDLENWDLLVDRTKEQVEELIEECGPNGSFAGWRPISVCGYAYAYDTVFVGGLACERRAGSAGICARAW